MIERRVGGVAILTFGGEAPLINVLTARNIPVFAVDADPGGPLLKTAQINYERNPRGCTALGGLGTPAHCLYRWTTKDENCHHAQIRRRKMHEGN